MSLFQPIRRRPVAKIANRRKLGVLETLEQRTVLSLMPFLPGVGELTVSGDTLYFAAGEGQNYPGNLWKTDGTLEGTMQVTNQPPYFEPSELTDVDGTLFFRGMTVPQGVELWRSDGTPGGTQFVADVNPNNYGGPGPNDLTNINGTLYFTGGWWSDVELWRSDGTAAGTYEVADINSIHSSGPHNMIAFDGDVFFTANDGVHGFELWRSDGTAAGTRLVKDIRPGPEGAGVDNTTDFRMTVAGSSLYFIAEDGEHGRELWTSDGTTEGTHLVLDITPGPDSHVNSLVAYDNALYFSVYGGPQLGLWRSDGTPEGTVRVKDLVGVFGLTVAGETLYFSGWDGEHGSELWKSLGTAETTQMVADAIPGPDGSGPAWLEPAPLPDGSWVVFYAGWDGHGSTLYRSDGTAAGTVIVRHSAEFAWPSNLVYFNDHIYFVGYQRVLWRTSVVNAGPPVADAGGPYTLVEGQSLSLDASATTDPDAVDVLEYAWDINADSDFGDATGVTPTLSWHELALLGLNTAANWDIRVRVRDGNGGETVSAPAALDISLVPPVVTGVHLSASGDRAFVPKFIGLGDLPGGVFASFGSAISSNGEVIVGYGSSATTTEPFRWTPATGLIGLGLPEEESMAILSGLSADGSTAVGYSLGWPFNPQEPATEALLTQENSYRHPIRWNSDSGFVRLDSPSGSYGSETPAEISADGTVAVGTAYWDDGYLGVQWDAAGHATLIGGPSLWGGAPGGPAYAVSADGSVVYGEGQFHDDIGGQMFYWTPETGAVALGVHGRPVVTSADGSVVVANTPHGILIVRPEIECEPVVPSPPSTSGPGANCTVSTSTTPLPQANGFHTAWDTSADASVIVGSGNHTVVPDAQYAFVWDAQHGSRLVADVLRERGYMLDHWTLTAATGVSADGTVLVGYGINAAGNPEAWRADLSPVVQPPVGSGEQLRPIGQVGIDQVSISFSEDVSVAADDLVVAGGNVDRYAISQFAYDPATHTAVWRLAQPIAADAVQITLASGAAGVRDVGSVALDGEWDNPSSISDPSSDTFPSGDGTPGGDFVFRFNVLPGDVDGDGAVSRGDLAMLVQQGFKRQGDPGFDPRFDVDGDGVIGALDAMFARDHLGDGLADVAAAPSAIVTGERGASADGLRRLSASRQRAATVTTPDRVDAALHAEASTSIKSTLRSTRRTR